MFLITLTKAAQPSSAAGPGTPSHPQHRDFLQTQGTSPTAAHASAPPNFLPSFLPSRNPTAAPPRLSLPLGRGLVSHDRRRGA